MKEKLSRWGLPLALAGGGVVVLLVFMLAALVIGGSFFWRQSVAEVDAPPLVEVDAPGFVESPQAPDAPTAQVAEARGVVEVLADGAWTPLDAGAEIAAGQRVRTGPLSAATLRFPDGSAARLGARTEIALLTLSAASEPRVVLLEQVAGQSLHLVQPDGTPGARYAVNTPSGVGEALGTIFGVAVSDGLARFSVDEGEVAVTGEGVTVQVQAGEVSTVAEGSSPAEPVFRTGGEGELTAMGDVWPIGGQDFVVTADTRISGEPQLGDWVAVDGRLLADDTLVADAIWVVGATAERFEFVGVVEAIGADTWTISGVAVAVDAETEIEADISVGDSVKVGGLVQEDGVWLATEIKLAEDADGSFEFIGELESIDPWIVAGQEIAVDDATEIEDGLAVGDLVKVEGVITEAGVWLATEIKSVEPTEDDDGPPGLGVEMVTLCHKPDGVNPRTITVASPAVPAHLGHGDTLGPCEGTTRPGGPPEGVPGGPPEGVGPPEGINPGPPEGVGPPEGINPGPPERPGRP